METRSFRDQAGRVWIVRVDGNSARRARDLVGVNVFKLVDNTFAGLSELLNDPIKLIDLLYAVCTDPRGPNAGQPFPDDAEFGASLLGDTLEDAINAFVEALFDFFPAKRRDLFREQKAKAETVVNRILTEARAEVAAADPALIVQSLKQRFGDAPASSASTPAASPSPS